MPPEIWGALIAFGVVVIGIGAAIARYVTAMVDQRTEDMKAEAKREREEEESRRKARDARRRIEIEEIRQRSQQTQALVEQVSNLTHAILDMNKSRLEDRTYIGAQFHEMRVGLSNHSESVGILAESVDKMALKLDENTGRSRAVLDMLKDLRGKVESALSSLHVTSDTPPPEQST